MLSKIKALFSDLSAADHASPTQRGVDELHLAAAALLVEAAQLDERFDAQERAKVLELLGKRFELSREEGEALLEAAEARVAEASALHGFTSVVKRGFGHDERIELLEMLWEVAYADGELHDFEAGLMRRVTGLLHVSDRDSGLARKRVLDRLAASRE